MSFEQALKELEAIVQELEAGKVDLEKSIERYERGEALKSHCERLLKEAEGRVEKIRLGGNGRPVAAEPLDDDAPF
jgi:exodeoxyribonuclease VII small subunit